MVIKKFNIFINENITSLLKGKSNDEMIKALEGLSNNKKIEYIIAYQLDYDLLPRDKNGRCIYHNNEDEYGAYSCNLTGYGIKKLPDNLTVHCNLICNNNPELTELPKGLIVNGDMYFFDYPKELKLPHDIQLSGKYYHSIKGKKLIIENIKDLLKGKSDDEIEKKLKVSSDENIARGVFSYNLPLKYLPKNYDKLVKDIIKEIKELVKEYGGNITVYDLGVESIDYEGETHYYAISVLTTDYVWVEEYLLTDFTKNRTYEAPYEELNYYQLSEIKETIEWAIGSGNLEHKLYESVKDLLKAKSYEDVEKQLIGLSDLERIIKIEEHDLPKEYLPNNYNDIKKILINGIKSKLKQFNNVLNFLNDFDLQDELYLYPYILYILSKKTTKSSVWWMNLTSKNGKNRLLTFNI